MHARFRSVREAGMIDEVAEIISTQPVPLSGRLVETGQLSIRIVDIVRFAHRHYGDNDLITHPPLFAHGAQLPKSDCVPCDRDRQETRARRAGGVMTCW